MENLANYLNDHLAGSVGALELLDRLVEAHEGEPLQIFFQELRTDIENDQGKLQELIRSLGAKESAVRKAGAWLAEKLSRPKMPQTDGSEGELGLFVALEALALGITGKRLLWRALATASQEAPLLACLDYSELERRALEQGERVEGKRLETARYVFKTE